MSLDEIIHAPVRLATMALLSAVERAEFTYIRDRVGATDGNLGMHLRKLEEAGYVSVQKRFIDRRPVSLYRVTARGRQAFAAYLKELDRLIRSGKGRHSR
jgi:DNA-binding MarR family transcriptional regulator